MGIKQSSIQIDVLLDVDKVPEQISWNASDTHADQARKAKAMMLGFLGWYRQNGYEDRFIGQRI